jgi:hypothetical protein
MVAAINWESSPSLTTYLDDELDDGGSFESTELVVGAAIDNSSGLDMYMDLELYMAAQGSARSSGAYVAAYLFPAVDGTNYPDTTNLSNYLIAVFALDAATTARREVKTMIPVPPGLFKIGLENRTGQDPAANSSTLKYRLYSVESQ